MDADKANIFKLLNGAKQYIVPVYQRLYSWEEEQCKRLWKDIIYMHKNNKNGHFLGSIVCIAEKAAPTGVQKYMVIDGQQRLTTLTLVLIALRDSMEETAKVTKKKINNNFLINDDEFDDDRYKLLLTEEDRNILISLINRTPIPEGTVSKLLNAYNYFIKEISNWDIDTDSLYDATGKLQIVTITLDRGQDDAQAIFESLNSTGKELLASDLIRNYILMGLTKQDQEIVYKNSWRPMELLFGHNNQDVNMDWFFRDYLTMKNRKIPKIGDVYDEFKKWSENSNFTTRLDMCNDFYKFAKYYTDIVYCRYNDSDVLSELKQMRQLKMDVINPFLLELFDDYENGIITKDEFVEILKLCVSYVLRRSVCDIPTNSLNKTFATFGTEINKSDYLNSVKAIFIKKDWYKEFPTDKEFGDAFVSKELYKYRNCNYILERLENNDNKSAIIINNLTIEHIMPQNENLKQEWKDCLGPNWKDIHQKYLHTIGNLTLTGYNSEMSDNPFMTKMNMKGGFKETTARLNNYIIKQTTWNEATITERANLLKDEALKIWPYPDISDEELAPYLETKVEIENQYSLETYNMSDEIFKLYDLLNTRILNLSPAIKREFKKHYIAYKLDTNFVDITPMDKSLKLIINMKFNDIYDPNEICKDVTNVGRWGNGDAEITIVSASEIDNAIEIINQSLDSQQN